MFLLNISFLPQRSSRGSATSQGSASKSSASKPAKKKSKKNNPPAPKLSRATREVLEKSAVTPFIDKECHKKYKDMVKGTWTSWDRIGKWYSVICTVAAHWVHSKDGKFVDDDSEEADQDPPSH